MVVPALLAAAGRFDEARSVLARYHRAAGHAEEARPAGVGGSCTS